MLFLFILGNASLLLLEYFKELISWASFGTMTQTHGKWQTTTTSKNFGGLGLKNLHYFNIALLSKTAWSILENPNSLLHQVYKSKYSKNSNLLHSSFKVGGSWGWRSISTGITEIRNKLHWLIGDGNSVKVWDDTWVNHSPLKVTDNSNMNFLNRHWMVSKLLLNGNWNIPLLSSLFQPATVNAILSITLPKYHKPNDRLLWPFTSSGKLTTNSMYKSLTQTNTSNWPHYHLVWKSVLPQNLKFFLWKIITNNLPAR